MFNLITHKINDERSDYLYIHFLLVTIGSAPFLIGCDKLLRDMPKLILLMFVGFFLILFISYYSVKGYIQDSSVKSMQETLRTTAIANRDDSARIERGRFILMKDSFEQDFKEKFNRGKNLNNPTTKYDFEYLTDGKDGIKAIKVKVVSGKETYQATCVLNVAE